jgi:histidyl-tRNA synthetase
MPSTKPARGMRDFLPTDVRRREYVIDVIREVYERYGFEPLETPAVENIETLTGKYGEEGNQLIYKILKRGVHESTGEVDLALRYDLTVPLARVVAEYRDQLPKFFKRYQIQPVWRADRPARGRFREFYQCDVDVLGSRSMVVETEICAAAIEALNRLGFTDFKLRLNHRQVLTGVLETAGIPLNLHDSALVAIDKLDKIESAAVARELGERGIEQSSAEKLISFFEGLNPLEAAAKVAAGEDLAGTRAGLNAALLGRLVEFVGGNELGARGIEELRSILRFAEAAGVAEKIEIDPTLARGLSYYTGAIMEINVKDLSGSLGGGGRYDNLVGMFAGQDVPACGFSLGLERIIVVMTERGMFPANLGSSVEVMVALWNEAMISDSLSLAAFLRESGVRVEVYPQPDKLAKQFKYASGRGTHFVALIVDVGKGHGQVSIKDMRTGEQIHAERSKLVEVILSARG